jgi:hypothetical protein
MTQQQQLTEGQIDRLIQCTGLEREDLMRLLAQIQSATRQEQLELLSQLTGKTEQELDKSAQSMRQRRLDVTVAPLLKKMLAALRPLRSPDRVSRYRRQFFITLEQALRLATLLEETKETDGYVYTVTVHVSDQKHHELAVTWRHPMLQLQSPLFSSADDYTLTEWTMDDADAWHCTM